MSPLTLPLMKHRTHDHLFAAAGLTAALSLIGTGATVLKGSVFHFDHWPLVAGDRRAASISPRRRSADQVARRRRARQAAGRRDARRRHRGLTAGPWRSSGTSAIGITVPVRALAGGETADGTSAGSGSPAGTVAGATRDGFGFSLGSAPSGSIDGTRDPRHLDGRHRQHPRRLRRGHRRRRHPGCVGERPGAPVAPATSTTTGSTPDRRDTTTPSAFTADPPTVPEPAAPVPRCRRQPRRSIRRPSRPIRPRPRRRPRTRRRPSPRPPADPAPADPAPPG